jgi:TDG/mug DNA glycosylase family protein
VAFTRAQLEAARSRTVPDLLAPTTRLLFVGINPGLWTAAAQAHFARPGNRFYPALFAAGILDRVFDVSHGYEDRDRRDFLDRGLGVTNLVQRPTARADELTREELVAGGRRLARLVARSGPVVVAVLGITAYRTAFGQPKTVAGKQPDGLGRSELWVVPNPSGLNAHASLRDLASAYREVAAAAGILSP